MKMIVSKKMPIGEKSCLRALYAVSEGRTVKLVEKRKQGPAQQELKHTINHQPI